MGSLLEEEEIVILGCGEEKYVIDRSWRLNPPPYSTVWCCPWLDGCCPNNKYCFKTCNGCHCCFHSCCCQRKSSSDTGITRELFSKCCYMLEKTCWTKAPCLPCCYFCCPCICCCCRPVAEAQISDYKDSKLLLLTDNEDTFIHSCCCSFCRSRCCLYSLKPGFFTKERRLHAVDDDYLSKDVISSDYNEFRDTDCTIVSDVAGKEHSIEKKVHIETPIIQKQFLELKLKQIKPRPASKTKPHVPLGCLVASKEEAEGAPPDLSDLNLQSVWDSIGSGAYLVYQHDYNGGQLIVQWTKIPPSNATGILAYLKPKKHVGEFKFTQNDGKTILEQDIVAKVQSNFVSDRKCYYTAAIKFIKLGQSFSSDLILLPAFNLEPPPSIQLVMFSKNQISIMKLNEVYNLDTIECIAAISKKSITFQNIQKAEFATFIQLAEGEGACITFNK